MKLSQYKEQKEVELEELEKNKQEEVKKREVIEREKERLIREHEDLLKTYFSKGYYKSVNGTSTASQFGTSR